MHGIQLRLIAILLILCTVFWMMPAAAATKGILEVRIKDHREAIDDFASLELSIKVLRLRRKSSFKFWQSEWEDLQPTVKKVDLTNYVGNRSVAIFRGERSAGAFDAVHLKLEAIAGTSKKGGELPVRNDVNPIRLRFAIRGNEETVIVFDLVVVDTTDHSHEAYELHVKGHELYHHGRLVEKAPQ